MAENRGKDFENVIRNAFEAVPDTSVIRLPDPTNGYLGIRNISDFVIYNYPYQYFIECKSVHGATFSIHSNDPKKRYGLITNNQWEGMLQQSKIRGIQAGVIIWWIDHDITRYYPIQLLEAVKDCLEDKKSLRFDEEPDFYYLGKRHTSLNIRGRKKRVFFEYDMSDFFWNIQHPVADD